MKIWENRKRKEMQNAIHTIFSCDKHDNVWWKTLNDINDIHFQTRNKYW